MPARKSGYARKIAATLFTTLLAPFLVNAAVRLIDASRAAPAPAAKTPPPTRVIPASSPLAPDGPAEESRPKAPRLGTIGRLIADTVHSAGSAVRDEWRPAGRGRKGDR
jgi:hypothetical protein